MSKFTKGVCSLLGLVLLSLLGSVIYHYQHVATLPAYLQRFRTDRHLADPWRHYLANYFFWTAVALLLLVVIAILIVLVWPRTRTGFKLDDKSGKLYVKKSAIEGLVKTIVSANGYMKNPQVSTKLYKKKFKVLVKGDVIPRVQIFEKTKNLQEEIETSLKTFLGLHQKLTFDVMVKNTDQKTPTSASNRVK